MNLMQPVFVCLLVALAVPSYGLEVGSNEWATLVDSPRADLEAIMEKVGDAVANQADVYKWQLAAKQVIRRAVLAADPSLEAVAWVEVDHSGELMVWWRKNAERWKNGKTPVPEFLLPVRSE
jgi:hypothetical protein